MGRLMLMLRLIDGEAKPFRFAFAWVLPAPG